MTLPRATYRLQFRNGMDFDKAVDIVPYIKQLGISHLYASPIFTAASGSTHGYDVTDHNEIDRALGGRAGFERLSAALKQAGLGLILDIVPNHMAASLENRWWRSVVEWGEASPYARHFDIDWREALTLPILGKPYHEALAAGELTLQLDHRQGGLALGYYETLVPLHPKTYAAALAGVGTGPARRIIALAQASGPDRSEALHEELRRLLAGNTTRQAIEAALAVSSRDADFVDRVHAAQPWRLSFWKDARRHLSYRRFFEVTGLAGVRIEDEDVFDDVHRLILELVASGTVDGLRVDHVDGLADPKAYLERLRGRIGPQVFVVVEKILVGNEALPAEWPIAGTTGYEFIADLAAVLADTRNDAALDAAYRRQTGSVTDLAGDIQAAKQLIVQQNFETELMALTRIATALLPASEADAPAAEGIESAIADLIVRFPVYRLYCDAHGLSPQDEALLASLEQGLPPRESETRRAILHLLKGDVPSEAGTAVAEFRTRFQQLTGPVLAKSIEDTLFYRFSRMIAMNEVGGEPYAYDGSVAHFHRRMAERARSQPHGLLATATHDTKRGEDARARLYAISEAPGVWADAVSRWRDMNAGFVGSAGAVAAPDRETEWMLYQSLAGIWPGARPHADELAALTDRFLPFVEKALREAKLRTDWLEVDEAYENAVKAYAARLLASDNGEFRDDFDATMAPFIRAGAINSLVQTLLKLTVPGIPDIYAGTERSDFSLVDPDNRRTVDFGRLKAMLSGERASLSAVADFRNGWAKQDLIGDCLAFRERHEALFAFGMYTPIEVSGPGHDNVLAFAREYDGDFAITIAVRHTYQAMAGADGAWTSSFLNGCTVEIPPRLAGMAYDRIGRMAQMLGENTRVDSLLASMPIALLTRQSGRPSA